MTIALVLAALLTVACVVVVALPFVRAGDPGGGVSDGLGEGAVRRLELAERRDRALAALKELEFDHRTGKVSDADYRELVGPLRREAAEALRGLEPDADAAASERATSGADGRPAGTRT